MYSTSELMTQAQIGSQAVALLYGPAGTDGETVLRYTSQPTVKVSVRERDEHMGRHAR